jgi:hypothetical protein
MMVGKQWSQKPDETWSSRTISFVGSSGKITVLLHKTVKQYEASGGHAWYTDMLAAHILSWCFQSGPEICGNNFRASQIMFTADPISYLQWCTNEPGCNPPTGDARRASKHLDGLTKTHTDALVQLLRRRSDISSRSMDGLGTGHKRSTTAKQVEEESAEANSEAEDLVSSAGMQ